MYKHFESLCIPDEQGSPFPFNDKQFDILFCSAVLEYVGDDEAQKYFVNECVRLAKEFSK